jgi:hypothetical protein
MHGNNATTTNGNAFEILGAHHCATAGPAGNTAGAIGDAGESDKVLTGGTYGKELEAGPGKVVDERRDSFGDRESPDVARRADGDGVAVYDQVGRGGGRATNRYRGKTSAGEGLAGWSEEGAFADKTGLRRSGGKREAVGSGYGSAGESAGSHNQDVVGTKRVGVAVAGSGLDLRFRAIAGAISNHSTRLRHHL